MLGIINYATAAYSRYKNPPRVIPASLFTRNENFGLENLPFDLLIDESHELEFDISDHAVENGATISDHIQERLRTVRVTGMFTNHSINGAGAFVTSDGKLNGRKWKESRVNIENAQAISNTALERWEKLLKIARARKKVRIITSLEIYEEMAIESVTADRGPDDGEAIKFKLTLREIRTADFQSENVNGEWDPPQPSTQAKAEEQAMSKLANSGNVSGDATETAEEAMQKMDEGLGRDYR